MRNTHLICSLTLLLAAALSFNVLATPTPQRRVLSFQQAQKESGIQANIFGSYTPRRLPNFIDGDGVHYGRCMVAILQNTSNDTLYINLPCGTLLSPGNDSSQIMLVTHDVQFPIGPGAKYASKFYAVCVQLHKDSPTSDDEYTAGDLADSSLVKVALTIEANFAQNIIGQYATWSVSDTANADVLRSYGANDESIAQTKELVDKAKVDTLLTTPDAEHYSWKDIGIRASIALLIFTVIPYFFKQLLFLIRRKKKPATLPTRENS